MRRRADMVEMALDRHADGLEAGSRFGFDEVEVRDRRAWVTKKIRALVSLSRRLGEVSRPDDMKVVMGRIDNLISEIAYSKGKLLGIDRTRERYSGLPIRRLRRR